MCSNVVGDCWEQEPLVMKKKEGEGNFVRSRLSLLGT